MNVTDLDNKKIIWNLLHENKYFDGFASHIKNSVKTTLDKYAMDLEPLDEDLSIKNMKIIKKMMEDRNKFLEKSNSGRKTQLQKLDPQLIMSSNGRKRNGGMTEVYSADHLRAQRMSDFDKKLQQQQQDMTLYLKPVQPEEVDFSENVDEELGDIDKLLEEERKKRDLDISNVFSQSKPETNFKSDNSPTKKVRFSVNPKEDTEEKPTKINDIFAKLKPIDNFENTVEAKKTDITLIDLKVDIEKMINQKFDELADRLLEVRKEDMRINKQILHAEENIDRDYYSLPWTCFL